MSDDNSLTLARQIAAQAWCTEANARKVMDVDLCDAFAHLMAAELDRLRAELDTMARQARGAETEADYWRNRALSTDDTPLREATLRAADATAQAEKLRTELARVTAELETAGAECGRLRGAVSTLLEIAEMAVDTRKCRVGVLRAMDDARAIVAAAPPATTISRAAEDVLSERQRQIDEEGWTVGCLTSDPEYDDGQLVLAATCYVLAADGDWPATVEKLRTALQWPGWQMQRGWRDSLVRAAALLLAQIERDDSEAPPA